MASGSDVPSLRNRKRKSSQISDVDDDIDAVPVLKIRPFSPLTTRPLNPSRIRPISRDDMVDQTHLAIDELGDPELILDEDKKARSQIKGKVGKNSKIKSSKFAIDHNGIHISESGDTAQPVAGPSRGSHRLDTIANDPNPLCLSKMEVTYITNYKDIYIND